MLTKLPLASSSKAYLAACDPVEQNLFTFLAIKKFKALKLTELVQFLHCVCNNFCFKNSFKMK